MNNRRISGAVTMLGKEIGAAEKQHRDLLAQAAKLEESIAEMKQAQSVLESLSSDKKKPSGASRKQAPRQRRKKRAASVEVDSAMVLDIIAAGGARGLKRSAVVDGIKERGGAVPARSALVGILGGLEESGSIRRDGYRFVAAGEAAEAEAAPAPEEAPQDGDAQAWEDPPAAAEAAPARRGRPRAPVSEEVAQAMGEVINVIESAGENGARSAAIRGAVAEKTGVTLTPAQTTRALKDLMAAGRIRRAGHSYFAV